MLTAIASQISQWGLFLLFAKTYGEMQDNDHDPLSEDIIEYIKNDNNTACLMVRFLCPPEQLKEELEKHPNLLNSWDSEGYSILDRIFTLDASKHEKIINQYLTCVFNQGVNLDLALGKNHEKGIHLAVLTHNVIAIKRMLKKYPKLLHHNLPCGGTIAHLAARTKNAEIIREILAAHQQQYGYRKQLDLDYEGRSPLHLASRNGQKQVVKELIIGHESPYTKDPHGYTPLDYAHEHQQISTLNILEKHIRHYPKHTKSSTTDTNEKYCVDTLELKKLHTMQI